MPASAVSGKASRQAAVLLKSLRNLQCPLVIDVDEKRFSDLALLPCEWRQKLLLWFLTEMDSSLALSLTSNAKGSVLTRLHDVFSSLGLCPAERQDLVSGSARRLEQLTLYLKLVHVVEMIRHQKTNAVKDDAVVEGCVRLMNDGISSGPLNRYFSSSISYLPPELDLQFRSEVEKRKAAAAEHEEEPLMWRIHAWQNEVLAAKARQDEAMRLLPVANFISESEFRRRTDDVQRLANSVERFLGADQRVFKSACEQRRALSEDEHLDKDNTTKESTRQFGESLTTLRRHLATAEAITESVGRMEEAVVGTGSQPLTEEPSETRHRLASEICVLGEELK